MSINLVFHFNYNSINLEQIKRLDKFTLEFFASLLKGKDRFLTRFSRNDIYTEDRIYVRVKFSCVLVKAKIRADCF